MIFHLLRAFIQSLGHKETQTITVSSEPNPFEDWDMEFQKQTSKYITNVGDEIKALTAQEVVHKHLGAYDKAFNMYKCYVYDNAFSNDSQAYNNLIEAQRGNIQNAQLSNPVALQNISHPLWKM